MSVMYLYHCRYVMGRVGGVRCVNEKNSLKIHTLVVDRTKNFIYKNKSETEVFETE